VFDAFVVVAKKSCFDFCYLGEWSIRPKPNQHTGNLQSLGLIDQLNKKEKHSSQKLFMKMLVNIPEIV
jgi:hypothetical protein